MKKKPNGFVSVLLALCLLLAPMTVFAESNAQLNYVTDDAGILTDSQSVGRSGAACTAGLRRISVRRLYDNG